MSGESFMDGRVVLHAGDCLEVMAELSARSIDSVVCDPPYGLGFMRRAWDHGVPGIRYWKQCLRLLKPGGHLVAFAGTRTYHRLACAIEDAGFEIRDQIAWCYGSGFPKSRDVSKAIDDEAGASRPVVSSGAPVKRMIPGADQHKEGWEKNNGREFVPTVTEAATEAAREWQGWGTALKPAWEPVVFARKPFVDTVAANVLKHGTGAINIDGCRVGDFDHDAYAADLNLEANTRHGEASAQRRYTENGSTNFAALPGPRGGSVKGRWPANIVHDGSEEVIAAFPDAPGQQFYVRPEHGDRPSRGIYGDFGARPPNEPRNDSGSAARFFYTAKADADDRLGSKHPTVKPVDLMQWLCRLVTPNGGTVLDPFAGTGTTGEAAFREGFNAVLIEKESESQTDIRRRMALCLAGPGERRRESAKAKRRGAPVDEGPLFSI